MAVRFLADEDVDGHILRALVERHPDIDCIRVQDIGLRSAPDQAILAWAADDQRVVLSHDVNTMTDAAKERMNNWLPMPGLVIISRKAATSAIIDELYLLAMCSLEGECDNRIIYIGGD